MMKKDGGAMSEQGLSSSYKEELLWHWEYMCTEDPKELVYYATSDLLDVRQEIYELGLESEERVKKADIALLEYVLKEGSDTPMWRPEDAPLSSWWWHLEKIAKRQYPAELLPEHLREIYLKAQKAFFSAGMEEDIG